MLKKLHTNRGVRAGFYVFVMASMVVSNFSSTRIPVAQAITAPSWPTTWTSPAQCSTDPSDESPTEADILGDTTNRAAGFSSDSNFLYFRERVEGNPRTNGGNFKNTAWVVLFQTSSPKYQYLGGVDGDHNTVNLFKNTTVGADVDFSPLFNDEAETLTWTGSGSTYARTVSATGAYFVDWAIPVSAFVGTGITNNTTKFFATSQDASNYNKDHLNCYEQIANLSIIKTDTPDPVTVGGALTYTLTVSNAGPDSSAGVIVNDTLPAGFSLTSVTPSIGSCSETSYPTIQCELGTLTNGASATVTIVGTATTQGNLSNTGTVTATTLDNVPTNNSSTTTTTVNPPAAVCGNGVQEGAESCDEGQLNGTPNHCNLQCSGMTAPICGNTVVESGEQCDEGQINGTPNHCNAQCTGITAPVCGNNVAEQGESCDEGQLNGTPNHCNLQCSGTTNPVCGNAIQEQGETCDDGQLNGTPNHCNAQCSGQTAPICGNAVLENTETCDDGVYNGLPNYCSATCDGTTSPVCGNGFQEQGETCDDGVSNGLPNYCNLQCSGTTAPVCGNSITEAGEACDEGQMNGESNHCAADCSGTTAPVCGNGTIEQSETCDQGELNGTPNNCNLQCNGITPASCGNAIQEEGESCDDGQLNGTPNHCNNECTDQTTPYCGNTIQEQGESCDDGELNGTPLYCSATCDGTTAPSCGNAVTEQGEACDEGQLNGQPTHCNSICTGITAPACNNHYLDEGEQCDGILGVGANQHCTELCVLVNDPYCGDGVKNDDEQCDASDLGGASCSSLELPGSPLTCTASCTFNTSQCVETPVTPPSGGGGGFHGLSVFNETTVSVDLPSANVSWFTNVSSTCTALYDSTSHDGSASAPSYGYGSTVSETTAAGTFHTAELTGLTAGTTYYWRPVCTSTSSSETKLGQQLAIAGSEKPVVLGIQAPVQDNPKVLGFELLPNTGGDLSTYYAGVSSLFALILGGLYVSYRKRSASKA